MRLVIATVVLGIGLGTSSADNQIATDVPAGTFRGPTYTTQFDNGTWTTTGSGTRIAGRYTIDDDLITFTTSPASCAQERVRYRFAPSPDGFRLKFLEDSCRRGGADIVYVRLR